MAKRIILGAHLTDRTKDAPKFQELITQYGCNIKTRIGLHDASDSYCSSQGLVLLEMIGDEARINELEEKLRAFQGIEIQKMVFEE
jgi:hypothetical protein